MGLEWYRKPEPERVCVVKQQNYCWIVKFSWRTTESLGKENQSLHDWTSVAPLTSFSLSCELLVRNLVWAAWHLVKCFTWGAAGCSCTTINVSAEKSVGKEEDKSSIVRDKKKPLDDIKTTQKLKLCNVEGSVHDDASGGSFVLWDRSGLVLNELVFWFQQGFVAFGCFLSAGNHFNPFLTSFLSSAGSCIYLLFLAPSE